MGKKSILYVFVIAEWIFVIAELNFDSENIEVIRIRFSKKIFE